MNNKKAIIVPCLIPGLAVIRSLGQKGVPITALHYQKSEMAQVLKYVLEGLRRHCTYLNPRYGK